MAKDPAFLFYDADAARDVSHMNRLERGCYFDFLMAQKKFGKLSITQVKKILGKDFETCWESVKMVLTYEKDMFYISWLQLSVEKRQKYSESRVQNRKGLKKQENSENDSTYVPHMVNENVNTSNNIGIAENFISKLSQDIEWVNKTAYSLGRETVWVSNMLNQRFKPHLISQKRNPPADIGEFARYFVNWARKQKDEIQTTYNDINSPPVNY